MVVILDASSKNISQLIENKLTNSHMKLIGDLHIMFDFAVSQHLTFKRETRKLSLCNIYERSRSFYHKKKINLDNKDDYSHPLRE